MSFKIFSAPSACLPGETPPRLLQSLKSSDGHRSRRVPFLHLRCVYPTRTRCPTTCSQRFLPVSQTDMRRIRRLFVPRPKRGEEQGGRESGMRRRRRGDGGRMGVKRYSCCCYCCSHLIRGYRGSMVEWWWWWGAPGSAQLRPNSRAARAEGKGGEGEDQEEEEDVGRVARGLELKAAGKR